MFNKNIWKIMLMAIAVFIISCNNNSVKETKETLQQDSTVSETNATTDTAAITATTIKDSKHYPDNEKSIVQIFQTGKLNPDEVDKNVLNKKWIGLYEINSMYFLRSTQLEVFPTTDTNFNVVRKVLMVKTSYLNTCVILISGLTELTNKDVQTAQRNKDTIFPGDQIAINFKNTPYVINGEGKLERNKNGTFKLSQYKLFLTSTINGVEIKQLLVAQPLLKNEMVSILWTGDLDGDGKLDLVINASPTKGYSTPALYLSSNAGQNELVKFVGQHCAR